MSLEMAILSFLSQEPMSGYDLKTKCFDSASSVFWRADQAQIYRTLERMAEGGLVVETLQQQSTRPDRRVWEITQPGRNTLTEELAATPTLPPLRDPFLLQLYFSAGLDDEALLKVLEARRAEYASRLARAIHKADLLDQSASLTPRAAVMKQTALDGAMTQLKALLEWLDGCIAAVRDGDLPTQETTDYYI